MFSKTVLWRGFSRGFGVTDFACTWLAKTKPTRGSGKPSVSEMWRRREVHSIVVLSVTGDGARLLDASV